MALYGPRLYRFYNYEQVVHVPAPVAGWNPDIAPDVMPENQAPVLDNFLIRPGKIAMRGAFRVWADLTFLAPMHACAVHPHLNDDQLIISRRLVSATAFVDPWNAPLVRPASSAALAAPYLGVLFAQGGVTVTTQTQATGASVPGPRGITFDGLRYFISYGQASPAVLDTSGTYYAMNTELGTQSGTTFTRLTSAPHGALDLIGHLSRIWLLGGIDLTGTTFNPLALYFTNPITAGGGATAADWKDPVSGLQNKIVIDGNSLDPGVGLSIVRSGLLVFRRASIWLLRGTTSASFVLQPVTKETGCIDARSIVQGDHGTYFLSHKGLMLCDGTTVRNVSGPVTQTIQQAVAIYRANVVSGIGAAATCAMVSDGQVLVSISIPHPDPVNTPGKPVGVWSGLYSPETGAWTRLTSAIWAADSDVGSGAYPALVASPLPGRLVSVGAQYITELEAGPYPGAPPPYATRNAGGGADDASIGSVAWTPTFSFGADLANPDGITVNSSGGSGVITHYLKATTFGLGVPAAATVVGVKADIFRYNGGGVLDCHDYQLRLVKGGVIQATDRADTATIWPGTLAYATYGGAADMWGTVLTPADVNAANFGIALAVTGVVGAFTFLARVDHVRLTVYYTIGSVTYVTSFVQGGALYDGMADGTYAAIPARWKSVLIPTGSPNKKGIAKRMFVDYTFQGDGIVPATGWAVTPKDESGNGYVAAASLPIITGSHQATSVAGASLGPLTLVQHFNQDIENEMNYVSHDITWGDSTPRNAQPTNITAELYGAAIEFQRTSDKR